jgi:tripartite ATP-independent transporter DctP family solute receptor
MKKWLFLFVIGLLLVTSGCGRGALSDQQSSGGDTGKGEGAGKEKYTIRLPHLVPEEQSSHVALLEFKKTVEERSDGRIEVQLFPNGSLYGSDRAAVEAVQLGNVEMTLPAAAAVAGFNKEFMVLDLPFLFDSKESAYKALDGEVGKQLLKGLEGSGLKGLVFGENGYRHISNNKHPITKPEDLEGLKIRTLENPVHTETFNLLGAYASPFAFGELYTALQQNTFDAMENPISLYYTNKFYEVQKYLSLSGHVYASTVLLINNDFYNSLPEDLQKVIDEASVEFRDYQRKVATKQDEKWLAELKKNGMEVTELTKEQKALFKEAVQPVYDQFATEIGEELIKKAQAANE